MTGNYGRAVFYLKVRSDKIAIIYNFVTSSFLSKDRDKNINNVYLFLGLFKHV